MTTTNNQTIVQKMEVLNVSGPLTMDDTDDDDVVDDVEKQQVTDERRSDMNTSHKLKLETQKNESSGPCIMTEDEDNNNNTMSQKLKQTKGTKSDTKKNDLSGPCVMAEEDDDKNEKINKNKNMDVKPQRFRPRTKGTASSVNRHSPSTDHETQANDATENLSSTYQQQKSTGQDDSKSSSLIEEGSIVKSKHRAARIREGRNNNNTVKGSIMTQQVSRQEDVDESSTVPKKPRRTTRRGRRGVGSRNSHHVADDSETSFENVDEVELVPGAISMSGDGIAQQRIRVEKSTIVPDHRTVPESPDPIIISKSRNTNMNTMVDVPTRNDEESHMPDGTKITAVAVEVDEEEQEEKIFALGVEYDPDSKPPIYLNRRFRLYGIGGLILLIIISIVMIIGIVRLSDDKSPRVVQSLAPTIAPTQSPTTTREAIYKSYFAEKVSPLVYVPGTPHYKAAEWIINEDPLQMQPDDGLLLQRYVMAFFYYHTSNNGNDPWRSCNPPGVGEDDYCIFQQISILANDTISYVPQNDKVRWLSGHDVCDWQGLICAGGDRILGMQLLGQRLTGKLPSELFALPFLQRISLAFNELTGTIPSEYVQFRHLLTLEVHSNLLTGTIPHVLYEQQSGRSLFTLNIGDNMLEGTIDSRIGHMTDLRGFHIFENNFDGTFPTEIGQLSNLVFSRINGNQFDGEIPTSILHLTQLVEFWGHEAGFVGTIPTQFGMLHRLTDLRIGGNDLTGTIPDEMWDVTSLIYLSMRENRITGTLSEKIRSLTNLQVLEISDNQLTGQIPSELDELLSLKVILVQLNLFEGELPTSICNNVLSDNSGITVLQADCFPYINPPVPCQCCTACCDRDARTCLLSDSG